MKLLITSMVTMVSSVAFAATNQSATTLPATNTVTAEQKEVIKKSSPLSFKFESWNERSQKSLETRNDESLSRDNSIKTTYKIDDTKSARLFLGANTSVAANGEDETHFMDMYVQYSDSKVANIEGKDIALTIRPYLPTSTASKNKGMILPQLRTYLSTTFDVTEKFSITPIINPRFYIGDNTYRDTNSDYAKMYYILEGTYNFNDKISWTVDLVHRNLWQHGATRSTDNILDTWVSVSVVGGFAFDAGMANATSDSNPEIRKSRNNYYLNLIYAL